MRIKWFGTASILLRAENNTILFDPYLPMNRRLYQPSLDEFAESRYIFITHGHFDHLVDVPKVLAGGSATVYCSATAAGTLIREGVESGRITVIVPGDSFGIGEFKVRVLRGKHIVFDRRLIARTLVNPRVLVHFGNLRKILRESGRYPEGQTLIFHVEAAGRKVLHMGSLNMDESENYPGDIDVLTVPFQGRSDLDEYSLQFVQRIKPKAVYLHHFDDSFPPISSSVRVDRFIEKMRGLFPGVKVIVPEYGETITI